MRWARENPEEMSRMSRLPVREQQDAMRAAVLESVPQYGDRPHTEYPCWCGAPKDHVR